MVPLYSFAARLEELKKIRGLSNSDLAKICKIDKSNFTRYCKGDYQAKQDKIYSIAEKLGVNASWLMGYDVPMEDDFKKTPVTSSDRLSKEERKITDKDKRFLEWFHSLSPEKQRAILISQDAPEDLL